MNNNQNIHIEKKYGRMRKLFLHPLSRMIVEVAVLIGVLFVLKVTLIKPGLGLLNLDDTVFRVWQGILTIALMFTVYVAIMRIYEGRSAQELSFHYLAKDGLIGTVAGAGLVTGVFAILWIAGAYHIVSSGSISPVLVSLIWVLLMAILEEMIFRGIVYRILEDWLGTMSALGLSAIMFGGMHIFNDNADWIAVLSATSGGLLMGALYSLTGRLWIPIFFHASWNMTQAFFGSRVSGADIFASYFESVREGPYWLTGGAFGIENSVITISLIIGLLVALFLQMSKRQLFLKSKGAATSQSA